MKTQIKLNQVILKTFVLFLIGTITSSAQNSIVTPLSDFVKTYKEKHQVISKEIEHKTNVTFTQKLAIHNTEINKLKEEFKAKRRTEYLAKSAKRAKRHKCVGDRSRGVNDCGYVYLKAPNDNMYTKKAWIQTEGADNGIELIDENSSIRMKTSVTGKNTEKGVIYAVFKYKPELINSIVEKESNDLFKELLLKGQNLASNN